MLVISIEGASEEPFMMRLASVRIDNVSWRNTGYVEKQNGFADTTMETGSVGIVLENVKMSSTKSVVFMV